MIIDGKNIAEDIFTKLQQRIQQLSFTPQLCDIVVGDDPVSLSFVKIKQRKAQSIGIDFKLVQLPGSAGEDEIINTINEVQTAQELCGLIVQLPLPEHLHTEEILSAIHPEWDVDGLSPKVAEQFYTTDTNFIPPTAGAVLAILDSLHMDLQTENFVVLGQGTLVGKPVTHVLQKRGYSVQPVDISTPNTLDLFLKASIIICGVGKAGFLTGDMVKEGVTVIDAGTSESGGSIKGDADFETVAPKAKFITPVPGGVGPVTVAKLLENVVVHAEAR